MRKYIYVGVGGVLGANLRYIIKNIQLSGLHTNIPFNTLAINMMGSFLLMLIFTIAYEAYPITDNLKLGITTGFMGAFTTFSTMCKEIVGLLSHGNFYTAFIYSILSIFLGLFSVYLGNVVGRSIAYWSAIKGENYLETASDDLIEGDE